MSAVDADKYCRTVSESCNFLELQRQHKIIKRHDKAAGRSTGKTHCSIAVISRRVYSIFRNYCTVKPLNYMRYLNIN